MNKFTEGALIGAAGELLTRNNPAANRAFHRFTRMVFMGGLIAAALLAFGLWRVTIQEHHTADFQAKNDAQLQQCEDNLTTKFGGDTNSDAYQQGYEQCMGDWAQRGDDYNNSHNG